MFQFIVAACLLAILTLIAPPIGLGLIAIIVVVGSISALWSIAVGLIKWRRS